MLPNVLDLRQHGAGDLPGVARGPEDRLGLARGKEIDQAAGVNDRGGGTTSFPTHRVSPSKDMGKSILTVRASPEASTSWLVNVRARISRAVAISHRR